MTTSKIKPDILQHELVGESAQIQDIRKSIARVAPTKLPVVLSGETGVGKDLIARLIHQLSDRADKPFVTINMAAIPNSLASASLFGHVKGAFTGATRNHRGMLNAADGGTIYLDELGEASLDVQRLLVNFLDAGSFVPLGGTKRIRVDVRVLAGTSTHPNELNSVLSDLFVRLSGFVLNIPPLRERLDDIPILVNYFMADHPRSFSEEAIEALKKYTFPGNIRELKNIIERAVVISDDTLISPHDLALSQPKPQPEVEDAERLRRELNRTKRELDHLRRGTIPADPIWEGRWIPPEEDYCFVLMPFADTNDLQQVYTQHVKPVVEVGCGLRCERADDIHDISGIMQSVWESVNRARLLIADLTDRNSNVFYELGIAHTLGKPVIMINPVNGLRSL